MLKIVTAPNPVLGNIAKRIQKLDANVLKLVSEMKETLLSAKDPVGVGLAAPQVEKPLQIFIVKPTLKSKMQVFINPKIIKKTKISHLNASYSKQSEGVKLEGCLSLPNIWGEVKRKPEVTVCYLDENDNLHTRTFSGFIATVIQHEMDHLNGILFTKRVLEQKGTLYKSSKNEKGEDVFEEIEI